MRSGLGVGAGEGDRLRKEEIRGRPGRQGAEGQIRKHTFGGRDISMLFSTAVNQARVAGLCFYKECVRRFVVTS